MTDLQLPRTTAGARKLRDALDTVLLNVSGITKDVFGGLPFSEKEFIESFLHKIGVSKNEVSKLEEAVEKLKQYTGKMLVLELVLAFKPDEETINKLHDWAKENISKNILLSLKTDPGIIGGALITFEGKYADISIVKKLEEALKPIKV